MMIPIAEAVLSSLESSAADVPHPTLATLRSKQAALHHDKTHHEKARLGGKASPDQQAQLEEQQPQGKEPTRRAPSHGRRDDTAPRRDRGESGQQEGEEGGGAHVSFECGDALPTSVAAAVEAGSGVSAVGDARRAVGLSLGKALMLGVAWAANVGGMATLTGTGPNIVLAGGVTALFPGSPGLSFATWMVFAFPMALSCLLTVWWALAATYLPRGRPPYDPAATLALIKSQRRQLGPLSYREACVLADFILLAVLWITRSPGFIPGWGDLFHGYATDATTAIVMATLLFAIPATPPRLLACLCRSAGGGGAGGSPAAPGAQQVHIHASSEMEMGSEGEATTTALEPGSRLEPTLGVGSILDQCSDAELEVVQLRTCDSAGVLDAGGEHRGAARGGRGSRGAGAGGGARRAGAHPAGAGGAAKAAEAGGALVSWPQIQARVPWGVLLLLGGGFALAEACRDSGLSSLLGERLSSLGSMPPTLVLLLLMLLTAATSTFTSNVATTSILLPVVAALATSMRVHPYLFMVPVTLTTSLSFILPVSTPPNALAFASGRLSVRDMAPLGMALCLACMLILLAFTLTLGELVFETGSRPSWAKPLDGNSSAAPAE
jgi:di/tricarboxylate transporter